ncbi:MAG: bis(5'-nucleosyl)-tetraphosphatase (symmetrical) YqeK [Eggerthellaceae bacterium]|nr:bis(5'-nucleosyl)-tetraphosphatase (symmetrical) YqeK [Eggerthellaceae bacterium]
MLAPEVSQFIRQRKLYGVNTVADDRSDVFSDAFRNARKAELLQRVGEMRYAHSLGVADTARSLAETYGADAEKAYLAGLLHDWDKGFDDAGIRARADELGLTIRPDVYRGAPQTLHGVSAAAALGREFPGIPGDVLQAIERHTTGAPDMSTLDMIIFIADALEPGRRFPGLDELRAQVGKVSLEDLFLDVESYWISLIVQRKKTLHPDTFAVWNTYAERYQARRHPGGYERNPGDWSRKPE